ncbi:MAG: 16S rRNA (guanine(966)-N(2))-methyltransferase RsmD [Deltaproteobacteria bacterium]|nr:16S rRNA (guanine(966)-N(2))-methyltransferase RsmD [Deltaproteobacteria bacterium]
MRIISGIAGGRRLVVPTTNDVRPTTDRVREALFSHLGSRVAGSRILDLFAGSGALGLESLSRGATSVVFVERSKKVFSFLKKNVTELAFEDRCTCRPGDGLSFLSAHKDSELVFDLIFLDPPYDAGLLAKALALISEHRCLTQNGLIVAEHRWDLSLTELKLSPKLQIVRSKQYGKTAVTTIEWAPPQTADVAQ